MASIDQQPFQLFPRIPHMCVLGTKWIWKTKLHSDDTLDCLKARYVAIGFSQIAGLDFYEIFSSVIKYSIVQ